MFRNETFTEDFISHNERLYIKLSTQDQSSPRGDHRVKFVKIRSSRNLIVSVNSFRNKLEKFMVTSSFLAN